MVQSKAGKDMGPGGVVALFCGLDLHGNFPVYERLLPQLIEAAPEVAGCVIIPDGIGSGTERDYDKHVLALRKMGFEAVGNVGVLFAMDPGSPDEAERAKVVTDRKAAIGRAERTGLSYAGGPWGSEWCAHTRGATSSYHTDPKGYRQRVKDTHVQIYQGMDPNGKVFVVDEVVSPHEIVWPLDGEELLAHLDAVRAELPPAIASRIGQIFDHAHQTTCGNARTLGQWLPKAAAAGKLIVHDSAAFTRGDLLHSCQPHKSYLKLEHDHFPGAPWFPEMFPPIAPFRGLIHLNRNTYGIDEDVLAAGCKIDGGNTAAWNEWMIEHGGPAIISSHVRWVKFRGETWKKFE